MRRVGTGYRERGFFDTLPTREEGVEKVTPDVAQTSRLHGLRISHPFRVLQVIEKTRKLFMDSRLIEGDGGP